MEILLFHPSVLVLYRKCSICKLNWIRDNVRSKSSLIHVSRAHQSKRFEYAAAEFSVYILCVTAFTDGWTIILVQII